MDFISAVILGIVQGVTEFLPISSTGHLIIVNQFVNFRNTNPDFTNLFDVVIQLGSILAVVVFFWNKIFPFGPGKTTDERNKIWDTWLKVFAGIIPLILIALTFGKRVEEMLYHPVVVASALLIGGIILIIVETRKKDPKIHSIRELGIKTAVMIGLIQCLAVIPGTSRSAATIIGALMLGLSRESAVEYSFFLAIPTMILASGYTLLKAHFHLSTHEWAVLGTGFAVAFLVAWAVIALFMSFIRKHDFKAFGFYRILLAAAILILMFTGVINKF